jgi:uncharacterized membrane protein
MQTQQRGTALAEGLGWFSIGLGLAELSAPRSVAQLIGLPDDDASTATLRAYGAREIATGIGILASRPHPGWLWARVAGDVLDMATLAAVMRRDGVEASKVASAMASVAGVMAADILAARRVGDDARRSPATDDRHDRVSKTFTVNREPEEVAQRWLELQMLPDVDHIRFGPAPGNRGTEVRVQFRPRLFGKLRKGAVQEQLRQFKQIVETGEVARSDGSASVLQPAQPIGEPTLAGSGGER